MWTPPAEEHQNGIVVRYLINVTVAGTGDMFQLFSNTNNITARLMPFTMYTIVLAAENSAGIGPYTRFVSIWTEEAGNTLLFFYRFLFNILRYSITYCSEY